MKLPLVFGSEATIEFDEAFDWYEERRPGLGNRFRESVAAVLDRVSKTPEAFAVVYKDVRCALARRFPYAVYFRAEK
jgi:hypothetical protein